MKTGKEGTVKKNAMTAPFDQLKTTKAYASRLAQTHTVNVYVFESAKGSNARAMGLRFGTFDETERGAYVQGGVTPLGHCDAAGKWHERNETASERHDRETEPDTSGRPVRGDAFRE